jgi:hypothetical protein
VTQYLTKIKISKFSKKKTTPTTDVGPTKNLRQQLSAMPTAIGLARRPHTPTAAIDIAYADDFFRLYR